MKFPYPNRSPSLANDTLNTFNPHTIDSDIPTILLYIFVMCIIIGEAAIRNAINDNR